MCQSCQSCSEVIASVLPVESAASRRGQLTSLAVDGCSGAMLARTLYLIDNEECGMATERPGGVRERAWQQGAYMVYVCDGVHEHTPVLCAAVEERHIWQDS